MGASSIQAIALEGLIAIEDAVRNVQSAPVRSAKKTGAEAPVSHAV